MAKFEDHKTREAEVIKARHTGKWARTIIA